MVRSVERRHAIHGTNALILTASVARPLRETSAVNIDNETCSWRQNARRQTLRGTGD
jgi:hypothetical protein